MDRVPTVNAVDSVLSGGCGGVIADHVEEDVLNWAGRLGWLPMREIPYGQRKEQASSRCTDYRLRVLPWPFGIAREKEKFQIKTC